MKHWLACVAFALSSGTGVAHAQTGDALLDRLSAAKERCAMQYRHGMERLQGQSPNHPNTRRSRAMIENRLRSCNMGADHAFERAQASQQRRGRR